MVSLFLHSFLVKVRKSTNEIYLNDPKIGTDRPEETLFATHPVLFTSTGSKMDFLKF